MKKDDFRIILKSDLIINSPTAMLSDLPADLKAAISEAFLDAATADKAAFDRLSDGKNLPWQPIDNAAYDDTIKMVEFVDKLRRKAELAEPARPPACRISSRRLPEPQRAALAAAYDQAVAARQRQLLLGVAVVLLALGVAVVGAEVDPVTVLDQARQFHLLLRPAADAGHRRRGSGRIPPTGSGACIAGCACSAKRF